MAKKKTKARKASSRKTTKSLSMNFHPDHCRQLPKLNRVEGQIAGIKKMIEERRYCPDIIQQVRATRKALFSIEAALLEAHLENCVSEAVEGRNVNERKEKLGEVMAIFKSADSQGINLGT